MRKKFNIYVLFSFLLIISNNNLVYSQNIIKIPNLTKNENVTQLLVNDKPFLILAGELGNSSASDINYLATRWKKIKEIGLNTLLIPVYWELIEPEEGKFDYSLIDSIIFNARKYNLKLIFLWFGSWKNSMSCYVPSWIKTDQNRFPRAKNKEGKSMEILSVFSNENRAIDAKAFAKLMNHIRKIDSNENTVIMVQVENEIGMIPDAREYSDEANKKYSENVPNELINYLDKNKQLLSPELYNLWKDNGFKKSGSWEEIFGQNVYTEEIFMAWYYAKYVDFVTKAGKKEYPLPMYVNAALNRPNYSPGQYPSGGPLPHLFNIWKAGAPSIDFLSPDIYFDNFSDWCKKYDQRNNPLFIPEATLDENTHIKALFAIGEYKAMGFSPFSIESLNDHLNSKLTKVYNLLYQLVPIILRGQKNNMIRGFLLDEENKSINFQLGEYKFTISHDYTFPWSKKAPGKWPQVGGMVISISTDEFFVIGEGIILTFESLHPKEINAGILYIEEGHFINNKWISGRRLNGDESHQGRHLRIPHNECQIQRVKLYRYH